MNKYYFPINSSTLAHYFGCACIKSAKYFDNKPQDIQDRFKEFLLLTNKKGTIEADCCLELVLTEDETKDLINVNNGWYLFDKKPLPITRIKKIYFKDKEQKDVTITNILMSTAYVPNSLVEICEFDENNTEFIQVPDDCHGIDQTNKINLYDRFLGALALMRLAHDRNMNYSQNYIATLSFFNKEIEKQLISNENLLYNKNFPYRGIFSNNNGFEKVLPYLNQHINEEVLNKIANENNQTIKKDKITRIIDVESFNDTWTYTIAILNAYGVGDESRKMRVDGLIQSNFSSLKEGKQEGVALCYGYNRGYSAFTKNYGNIAVKYKLDSKLDYYTIESVYQYVFNGVVSSEFNYLDDWCPRLSIIHPKQSSDYVILDELVIGKKKTKVFSPEWWNGFSQKFEKAFGSLAKPILDLIKPIIEKNAYDDICDELQESFQEEKDIYQQRVRSLRTELDKIREELNESNKLNKELQDQLNKWSSNNKNKLIKETNANNQSIMAEPNSPYGNKADFIEERLKNTVVQYKDYTLKELKKNNNIKDTSKLSDLLLSQPNELFSK